MGHSFDSAAPFGSRVQPDLKGKLSEYCRSPVGLAKRDETLVLGSAESIANDLRIIRSRLGFEHAAALNVAADVVGTVAYLEQHGPGPALDDAARRILRDALRRHLDEVRPDFERDNSEWLAAVQVLDDVMFLPVHQKVKLGPLRKQYGARFGRNDDYVGDREDDIFLRTAQTLVHDGTSTVKAASVAAPSASQVPTPVIFSPPPPSVLRLGDVLVETDDLLRRNQGHLPESAWSRRLRRPKRIGQSRRRARFLLRFPRFSRVAHLSARVDYLTLQLGALAEVSQLAQQELEADCQPEAAEYVEYLVSEFLRAWQIPYWLSIQILLASCYSRSHRSHLVFARELGSVNAGRLYRQELGVGYLMGKYNGYNLTEDNLSLPEALYALQLIDFHEFGAALHALYPLHNSITCGMIRNEIKAIARRQASTTYE